MDKNLQVVCGDCLEVLRTLEDESFDAVVTDPPAGIGFMGKDWDKDRGGRDAWIAWLEERLVECLRVLKPGGHLLAWALPRTTHWTAFAIENAGFDLRDRIAWLYGTGFPKTSNISKQIDKSLGVKPTVVGKNPNHRAVSGVNYEGVYAGGNTGSAHLTVATSEEAKAWEGWGSALKPSCEDWWLARKPFKGAVYKNVLEHGVGALNVDACRIPTDEKLTRKLGKTTESASGWKSVNRSAIAGKDGGRWPPNAVLDEAAAELLDAQEGVPEEGASRFFYVAKASQKEKREGLRRSNAHPTVKPVSLMRWLCRMITPPGGIVLDPFCGSGTTGVACAYEGFDFLGIDADRKYVATANKRLQHIASIR